MKNVQKLSHTFTFTSKKILFRGQKDNVLLSEFFDDITISAQVGQGKDGNQLGAQSGAWYIKSTVMCNKLHPTNYKLP